MSREYYGPDVGKNLETATRYVDVFPADRIGKDWEYHSNVWSGILGAVAGAGTVLLIAGVVLMWKKPKRREQPLLAPMDVGHNVSRYIN